MPDPCMFSGGRRGPLGSMHAVVGARPNLGFDMFV